MRRFFFMRVAAFVLDANGKPVDPIRKPVHAKRLLRNGSAKVVVTHPLTLQLTRHCHDPRGYKSLIWR